MVIYNLFVTLYFAIVLTNQTKFMMAVLILALGLPLGILVFILYQILKDPGKAEKYKALFISPFFKLFKWGAKNYIGSKVSYQVSEYFNRHIIKDISDQQDVNIQIKWIESAADPIFKGGNSIIVCLKKSNDQTKNILNAAEVALPIITYKYLRSNIDKHVTKSIDLVTLKKLAEKLGKHGAYTHRKYFLDVYLKEDERIAELFQKLVEIDNRGYFVPIFLNELENISESVYATSDLLNRTTEIIEFIEYLIEISRVEVGAEVKQWHYISEKFSVAIELLANNLRMVREGVSPYVDRINKNLRQGIDSIYVLSEENSWDFLNRFEKVLSENDRIFIKGRYNVSGIVNNQKHRKSKVKITLLRKIDILADDLFKEKIIASDIKIGSKIIGEVIDISDEISIISIAGLDGFIKINQCSWHKINSCEEVLSIGEKIEFKVKEINENKMAIELSLLFDETDPWAIAPLPKIGDEIDVIIYLRRGNFFYCNNIRGQEFILSNVELSWNDITDEEKDYFLHKTLKVKVIEIQGENKSIFVSIRNLENDPWPEIHRTIKSGTDYIGKVKEVKEHFVKVEIKEGLNGIIPKERLIEAGGAFLDYKNNMVIGQGVDVYVTRVFIDKRKIHLDLKQNKKK